MDLLKTGGLRSRRFVRTKADYKEVIRGPSWHGYKKVFGKFFPDYGEELTDLSSREADKG